MMDTRHCLPVYARRLTHRGLLSRQRRAEFVPSITQRNKTFLQRAKDLNAKKLFLSFDFSIGYALRAIHCFLLHIDDQLFRYAV